MTFTFPTYEEVLNTRIVVSNYCVINNQLRLTFTSVRITFRRGAAIAQWIRLRLPSCRPGFESQAHHLNFYHGRLRCIYSQICAIFVMWNE